MPGSLTTPGRPGARDDAPGCVAFHHMHGVGTQDRTLSRLNGWPMRSPVNASPRPSRATAHDSGPMWIAIPSSQGTCTLYSLPVSRRFAHVFRVAPDSRHSRPCSPVPSALDVAVGCRRQRLLRRRSPAANVRQCAIALGSMKEHEGGDESRPRASLPSRRAPNDQACFGQRSPWMRFHCFRQHP